MKKILRILMLMIAVHSLLSSCKEENGDYAYVNSSEAFSGNTYEYLQNKTGIYDSLLFVVNRLDLQDTLKNQHVTLFAPNNQSFQQVVEKLNLARKLKGKAPVYLKDIALEILDSMVCRYIIRGEYTADSLMQTDGLTLTAVRYNYPMNGKLSTSDASGYKKGGPGVILFSDTKRSAFVRDWITSTADAINIRTSNGVVHVLESIHAFGFGEYTRPVPEPFDQSIFRPSGYSGVFVFPVVANETLVIEAEDFDMGGEGVAVHHVKGNKVNYRPSDGLDIDGTFGSQGQVFTDAAGDYVASYSIGSSKAGDWAIYSVNVPVEGDYIITTRAGNANASSPLKFHIDFDLKNVTGSLSFNKGSGWYAWQLIESPVFHLKAGNHKMRFYWESNDIQLNNFVIKRIN